MQIIIPMSGFGERFRRAGYDVPKPLIEVDGKPIIEHVVGLFPGETDVVFVCNQDHLDDPRFRMRDILDRIAPASRIVGIPGHKQGPVYAVNQVLDHVDMTGPVVVNYCDFACFWDWQDFRHFVAGTGCDGAIPAYRGFHPHSLGTTNYAYMRETNGWLTDIQEKAPFTDNRLNEFASSGTYYFASGSLMRTAFQEVMSRGLSTNGEYYVSMAFKPLVDAGRRIAVYELQHFMQWGTPEDLDEYRMWSEAFRRMVSPEFSVIPKHSGSLLVPMAGLGARFTTAGYTQPKPLIPVSGKAMVIQATAGLPETPRTVFVLRQDMPHVDDLIAAVTTASPAATFAILEGMTEGQACSALAGFRKGQCAADEPLTIGTCDSGALYHAARLQHLLDDTDADVIVWVARGYVNAKRKPHLYGWADCDGDLVTRVSVKKPLSNPAEDPIIIGTFTFRRGADLERVVERLVQREGRINGEYYLDSCIEDAIALGLTCRILEIDSYLCWGTPDDLKTFEYWQSCFHKWGGHPYSLEEDPRVAPEAIPALAGTYAAIEPARPTSSTVTADRSQC